MKKQKTESKTVTLTRRIEIYIDEPDVEKRKDVYKLLSNYKYMTFKAANIIVNKQYANFLKRSDLKNSGMSAEEVKNAMKEILGTSNQNSTYREISEKFPELPSLTRTSLNAKVLKCFNADMQGVLNGDRTIRNYKLGMPIPFNSSVDMFSVVGGEESSILTYKFRYTKDVKFVLNFGKDKSGNRIILDSILAGEYKLCDSEIIMKDKSDNYAIYLSLTFTMPKTIVKLDYEKYAATNLGMNCPLYLTTSEGHAQGIGHKEEFWNIRKQFQIRASNLQRFLKTAKGGRGRSRKLKALSRLKEAEKGFAKTYNHKISKQLVMFCLKNGIGVIKTENLLGGSETLNKEIILRNWGYYQLQSQIEYKASMYGIKVVVVSPQNITNTCNCCKNIDEKCVNLEKRVYVCNQQNCNNFNKEVDIDKNASLNVLVSVPAEKK